MKSRKAWLAIAIVMIVCPLGFFGLQHLRSPGHRLKPLMAALDRGNNYTTNSELERKLEKNAPIATKYAVSLLKHEDSWAKKQLMTFNEKYLGLNLGLKTSTELDRRAKKILYILGERAKGATSALAELIKSQNDGGQWGLFCIGDSAVPLVTNLLAHTNKDVRVDAAFLYAKLEGRGGHSTEYTAPDGRKVYEPSLVVADWDIEQLCEMLESSNPLMRRAAVEALETYSGAAGDDKTEISALKEVLDDPDPRVRRAARKTLKTVE